MILALDQREDKRKRNTRIEATISDDISTPWFSSSSSSQSLSDRPTVDEAECVVRRVNEAFGIVSTPSLCLIPVLLLQHRSIVA